MNSTITTRLAYCLAWADALAQRLLPAVELSFEYLTFLINRAETLSEMDIDQSPASIHALVEDDSAVALATHSDPPAAVSTSVPQLSVIEATTTKIKRKTSKPMGFTTSNISAKRRGKRPSLCKTA